MLHCLYLPSLLFFTSSPDHRDLHSFPTRRSSDLAQVTPAFRFWPSTGGLITYNKTALWLHTLERHLGWPVLQRIMRSEEHTSELQSRFDLVCRLLLEKKKTQTIITIAHVTLLLHQ